jgi:branched-chain amino acid transport system permease protein
MAITGARPLRLERSLGRLPVFAVAVVALGVIPLFLPPYLQSLMTKIVIYALFAIGLDLIYGYAGLPSLGHAAYFGVGAYTVGVLMVRLGVTSFWITAPAVLLISALAAAVLGLVALRVKGTYFLLVTFALGQLLFSVAFKAPWLSSFGVEGLAGLSKPNFGVENLRLDSGGFYYFTLAFLVLGVLALRRLASSPFGLALQGIRQHELRMKALGYNVWLFKYLAFVIAGVVAGVAGMLFAYHRGIVLAGYFDVSYSALAFLIVIIGGAGTIYGPIFGAMLIGLLEYYASALTPERWPLLLGAVFVLSGMFGRGGVGRRLIGFWERMTRSWTC